MVQYIKFLIEIGLTESEAKVYFHLLKKNHFTATEIASVTKIARTQVYDILANLISKNMCMEILGSVRRFSAISPEIALKGFQDNFKQKQELACHLTDTLSVLYSRNGEKQSPLDFIQVYSTPASIIKKHHTLELESRNCVLSFCKPPYAMSKEIDIHPEQRESMEKGVIYKSIFEVEKDNLLFFAKQMKNFELQGEEIKVAYHLPIKLHVFDDHTVMFSMINQIDPDEHLTYLVIEHKDLAETLISTFYLHWDQAISVDDFLSREKITL